MNVSNYYSCFSNVAVLGNGAMGSQIAAHCANAGLRTMLFGLGKRAESRDSSAFAIAQLKNTRPPALASPEQALNLQACNYDEDLPKLKDCHWLIEAVSEDPEIKRSLYERIAPHLNDECALSSNTSGISLNQLAKTLPVGLQARFLGTHFFNPPRYMPLVELIPGNNTAAEQLDKIEGFLISRLGKNVVHAKDSAGFIANRFGLFSMASALHHAEAFGLGFDLVDELTGAPLHRPKSATCRTMDLVGLDILLRVGDHLYNSLSEDPWRKLFKLPDWLRELEKQGRLGEKTKCGIYRKNISGAIEVYQAAKGSYVERQKSLDPKLKKLMEAPAAQRWSALAEAEEPQAAFLYAVYRDLFHYAACHADEVAHNLRDIDLAMRWGYGWQEGIFDLWQMMGWQQVRHRLEDDLQRGKTLAEAHLPDWCRDSQRVSVYQKGLVWSPEQNDAVAPRAHAVEARQLQAPRFASSRGKETGRTLFANEALRLWCDKDEIAILSLKTKMNTLNYTLISSLADLIGEAERQCQGLIVWSPQAPFCAGANLLELLIGARVGKITKNTLGSKLKSFSLQFTHSELPDLSELPPIATVIEELQSAFMKLHYCKIPTVAAVRGLALGGGCEMLLHCDHVVAALESYIGLVEIAVGLIPAGGGCAEMARRAHQQSLEGGDLFPRLSEYYKNMALGRVSSSAFEARTMGYLRPGDTVVMHSNEILAAAKKQVEAMQAGGYRPPSPQRQIAVAGRAAAANCKTQLATMRRGRQISAYDVHLGGQLAEVLCGGGLDARTMVDEAWLLDLERHTFLSLLSNKLSQERVEHMLKKNKPLRN